MNLYIVFSANMIAAVTISIDNLIVLAVKEQWNSKGRIVWHRNVLALVIQAILMNNKKYGPYIVFICGKIFI